MAIKSVADKRTERFLKGERVPELQAVEWQAQKRLLILNEATSTNDLRALPSNRFEALEGDRKGQYSIRINDRWRICFAFAEGDAENVEIVDDH